ncbi:MAG: hypothetical protein HY914_20935 [Desulfomonile tiedjei]|nr:hypothetical protein [Desulfomonile tiedjei]
MMWKLLTALAFLSRWRWCLTGLWLGWVLALGTCLPVAHAADMGVVQAEKLLRVGQELSDKTNYLEALDLMEEARLTLEAAQAAETGLYGDTLFAIAETKIKGRLHQGFPAQYVKTALKDIRAANKLREMLRDVLPQKLGEGYYLEGYVLKKFFLRNREAIVCFRKAVKADPSNAAAKRELSELIPHEGAAK